MQKVIWASYGQTESGDDIPILLWDHQPTDEEMHKAYKTLLPAEYVDGDGEELDGPYLQSMIARWA